MNQTETDQLVILGVIRKREDEKCKHQTALTAQPQTLVQRQTGSRSAVTHESTGLPTMASNVLFCGW